MTELIVWVNGREKRLSGVARSTTCHDVVALLLRDHLRADDILPSYCESFSLFERWRGCERILSPRTRLYKLWKAWGHEQKNVCFTLKKSTPGEPHLEKIGDELIGHGDRKSTQSNRIAGKVPISVDESRKRVRHSTVRPLRVADKAHRKSDSTLSVRRKEKTRKSKAISRSKVEPKGELDSLVHTVVKQNKRLQELLEKVSEIDSEIEFYETKAHILRIEENGKNYVQEAYLNSRLGDSSQSDDAEDNLCELVTNGCSDLESYISLYERLLDVESQLTTRRGEIADLSGTIERHHINQDTVKNASGNHAGLGNEPGTTENAPLVITDDEKHMADHQRDIGLVRAQLEWYTDVCIAQRSEITTMHNQLATAETLYNDKCHWLDILLKELERLEISSITEPPSMGGNSLGPQNICLPTEECDDIELEESKIDDGHDSGISVSSPDDTTTSKHQCRFEIDTTTSKHQCRCGIDTDSSSDTGLSSLHSQDDIENLPVVAETLV
ncbi:ras association domain-containing protein 10-like [Asterias amurensis]|uniref:ras association domain-containing protein 10-like n=1 Tax=Asterias amurensis TaxID=7602 RepID=UPI003AB136C0